MAKSETKSINAAGKSTGKFSGKLSRKLGRLEIETPFVLAPMASYSDICLRTMCREYGCSYAFTELIHAPAFIRKVEALKEKLDFHDPIGLQFIANKPEELKEAIRMVNEREFYSGLENVKSIDLNLGCPSPDIMRNNLGSALLNQPKTIRDLFKVMRKYSDLPVSAKMRIAINAKHKKTKPYLRIAKIAKEEELDFITIHARTAGQQYAGEIDFEAIKETRENVDIPLIGNGNVIDEESAMKMLEYCDAVMIGRQAVKDPFIFQQLNYFLEHGK
ncbi:MAG: tRNA-dihydrouridine synthase family protein, partial [Nanoarchaeota archaeon]|nr:tRNA-dihydrouridine synthase family protein [Nanoarchaeota archaeon]